MKWLEEKSPLPYWGNHAVVAVLIGLACHAVWPGWPLYIGAAGYVGREFWQYFVQGKRHKGRFDFEGLTAPVIATALLDYFSLLGVIQ